MKIISLQPSVSIILDRLGCLDSLAACTKYCLEAVPALRDRSIPVIHDSWSTKAEELLPVPADLVIASVPYRQESLTAILKSGRPVLTLSPRNLADIYQDIRLIAAVVQVSEAGEALIEEMQSQIEDGAAARHSGWRQAAGLLRGVGQAPDPLAALGHGAGRGWRAANSSAHLARRPMQKQ